MPRMRIRQIKPEYFDHDDLGQCSIEARYLGIGLLCFSDDRGYWLANPRLIRSRLFPLDGDELVGKIVTWLGELIETGFLEVCIGRDRKLYGRIPGFLRHQYIQKPQPSEIEKRWSEASLIGGERLPDAIAGIFRYNSGTSTVSVSPGSDRIGSDRIGPEKTILSSSPHRFPNMTSSSPGTNHRKTPRGSPPRRKPPR